MTVEDFAQMITADNEDYELVEGELVPLSSGTPRHAELAVSSSPSACHPPTHSTILDRPGSDGIEGFEIDLSLAVFG